MFMSTIIQSFSEAEKDTRTRKLIPPTGIVLSHGAKDSDVLIGRMSLQPCFDPPSKCILCSDDGYADILFDFGAEIHGTFCFSICDIKQGDQNKVKFKITLGESVSEATSEVGGGTGAVNDHSPREIYTELGYYSRFETNQSGFRYARLTLLSPNTSLELVGAAAMLIYHDIPYIGSFECSDEKLNRIFETAAYTAHLNLQDYLWDGIKRDRLVWIGDMHTEVKALLCIFGSNEKSLSIIKKSLDLVRDCTPASENMNGISSYSMWWVAIHSELYRFLGDIHYLSEQKDYLKALIKRMADFVDRDGCERVAPFRFLDWPTSKDKNAVKCGMHALLSMTLKAGAELCRALGEDECADTAERAALRLKSNPPQLNSSKQAAALLALSGIYPPEKANMYISKKGSTDSCADGYSCFFAYYILAAKALAGDAAGAVCDMREYYGSMLDMGATTFWEDFDLAWVRGEHPVCPITRLPKSGERDIHADFGAYCYKGHRHSLCHGWSSGPVPFICEHILGVKNVDIEKKQITVKPDLAGLKYIKGTVPTALGTVSVTAEQTPQGIKADIVLPQGVIPAE